MYSRERGGSALLNEKHRWLDQSPAPAHEHKIKTQHAPDHRRGFCGRETETRGGYRVVRYKHVTAGTTEFSQRDDDMVSVQRPGPTFSTQKKVLPLISTIGPPDFSEKRKHALCQTLP